MHPEETTTAVAPLRNTAQLPSTASYAIILKRVFRQRKRKKEKDRNNIISGTVKRDDKTDQMIAREIIASIDEHEVTKISDVRCFGSEDDFRKILLRVKIQTSVSKLNA